MNSAVRNAWCYDDSVLFDRDGRTIHGYVRFGTGTPGVFEVEDAEDAEEWRIPAGDLRPGPVTLIQKLAECDAQPPHPRVWVEIEEHRDSYPVGCPLCDYEWLAGQHSGCEHARHGRWRAWRVTHRFFSWTYSMGITTGGGCVSGGGCRGCALLPRLRGTRHYILGVSTDHWRCLLRGRHWPGEPIGWGLCGKCAPCPGCGSTKYGCEPGCPETEAMTA